jgi:SYP5 family syntaxin
MTDVVSWRSQLSELESLIDQGEKRLTGPRREARDKRTIKQKIPQYEASLQTLDNQLTLYSRNPLSFGLDQSEVNSYIARINGLRGKIQTLEALCQRDNESAKSALLGDPRYRNIKDSDETVDMTNQDLYNDQLVHRANEDAKLDNISDGLGQLNDIARQQNQKLTHHGELVGNLNDNIDIVDENMRHNIKRVDIVEENTRGGCISLLVMVAILVLIVVTIATNWACVIFQNSKRCK